MQVHLPRAKTHYRGRLAGGLPVIPQHGLPLADGPGVQLRSGLEQGLDAGQPLVPTLVHQPAVPAVFTLGPGRCLVMPLQGVGHLLLDLAIPLRSILLVLLLGLPEGLVAMLHQMIVHLLAVLIDRSQGGLALLHNLRRCRIEGLVGPPDLGLALVYQGPKSLFHALLGQATLLLQGGGRLAQGLLKGPVRVKDLAPGPLPQHPAGHCQHNQGDGHCNRTCHRERRQPMDAQAVRQGQQAQDPHNRTGKDDGGPGPCQ